MSTAAHRFLLTGRVQGVGFRPFVYRLALRHGLTGTVRNALGQVEILLQGPDPAVRAFASELVTDAPPLARAELALREEVTVDAPFEGFAIVASEAAGVAEIHVPPDQFLCDDCRAELEDPTNRRYRYPFINCTQCGPRYTLIERMPYDRPNTTMQAFPLCAPCRAEYTDPRDRRYHAEPIACPDCGPHVTLVTPAGSVLAEREGALAQAIGLLRDGAIVAVRGVGGYHLMADAGNEASVARLRARKLRPAKPLAVMYPRRGADGLARLALDAEFDAVEAAALLSPTRPIVIVRLRDGHTLAASIAPGLGELGAFLPYSPLHELLLAGVGGPLVATSGNLSGEPVLTDPAVAHARLGSIADAFLDHDRPIARPADDPVLRRSVSVVRPLRIGRGLAPLELELPVGLAEPVLAVGAHLKNCIALGWGRRLVLSPHIGTLDSPRALAVFEQVIGDLQALYGIRAREVVCDAHRDYGSTRFALRSGLAASAAWHHAAHASALAVEHALPGRALVFTWDGVGLGPDGTLWGGEALAGRPGAWRRVARLRPFRLPGGDAVTREPWRTALSLCLSAAQDWPGAPPEAVLLREVWARPRFSPLTSSAGRVFDAAAALVLGIRQTSFEGEAPMRLEAASLAGIDAPPLSLSEGEDGVVEADWAPLLPVLLDATRPKGERGGYLHEALAQTIAALAGRFAARERLTHVGLTGGVFQNRLLTERAADLIAAQGLTVLLPARLPANDAAIAVGQLVEHAAGGTHPIRGLRH